MKKLLFISLLLSLTGFGQMLDNSKGYAFTDKPFFNEEFIKTNKIKKLTGKYSLKKPGKVIQTTEYKYVFSFDTLGHLISTYETKIENGFKDTIINLYEYSKHNQLIVHWKNDSHGYTSNRYHYDSLNRVIAEEVTRDILGSNGKVEKSIVLNRETMKYDNYKNQTKKTIYNSYDLPYMEVYCNFNDDGYLLNTEERMKMTSNSNRFYYEYNDKGYMSAYKIGTPIEGKFEEEWFFKYDKFGQLYEKHTYKNGEHVTDLQIIYNDQTKLLSSVLTRDVRTNYIYILRFQNFEFYK